MVINCHIRQNIRIGGKTRLTVSFGMKMILNAMTTKLSKNMGEYIRIPLLILSG
jgi:hypothetical protein